MIKLNASIRTMTLEEQLSYNLHNSGLMLDYQNRSYFMNAGTRDTVEVFALGVGLYVLTMNSYLGYIGLDSYMPPEQDPVNTMFLQVYEVEDLLGIRWKNMSTEDIDLRLMEYPYLYLYPAFCLSQKHSV